MKRSLLLVLLILYGSRVSAQTVEPLRPALLEAGGSLLEKQQTPEEFFAATRKLREARSFSQDERAYLKDLSKKVPLELRQDICPDDSTGLCGTEVTLNQEISPPAESTEFEEIPDLAEQEGLNATKSPPTSWSKPLLWTAAVALALVAGSIALNGKEIQIQRR